MDWATAAIWAVVVPIYAALLVMAVVVGRLR
jgi:hypothetical protein